MEIKDIIKKQIEDCKIRRDLMIKGLENLTSIKSKDFSYIYNCIELIKKESLQIEYLQKELEKHINGDAEKKERAREILGLKKEG